MNGASVVGKLVKLNESHIANVTFVAFSGVTTNVRLEVIALGKRLRAVRTFVGFQSVVSTAVYHQIVMTMETFPADRAEMSFFIGVIFFVNIQIRSPGERFRTELALVRLNTVVSSHVNQQIIVPHEALTTLGAEKSFALHVLLLQMLPVQIAVGELLLAMFAGDDFLLKVSLPVVLQGFCRRKTLLAYVANFGLFRRFLFAVLRIDVIPEMFRPLEGLFTELTFEWPFSGMLRFMFC